MYLYGGYSFGRRRPTLELRFTGAEKSPTTQLHVFKDRPRDLGPVPAISGVLNTLASLTLNQDYTDLYFSSGVSATHTFSVGPESRVTVTGRREEQSPGRDVVSSNLEDTDYRPVIWLNRGTWTSLEAAGSFATPWKDLQLTVEGRFGHFDYGANAAPDASGSLGTSSGTFGSVGAGLSYEKHWLTRGATLDADLRGRRLFGDAPAQAHFFLGGRQTLPGYAFRSQIGKKYWLARLEGSADLIPPFVRLRAFTSAGRAWGADLFLDPADSFLDEPVTLVSAGLGVGLGWDVIRLDFARGLREGGEWKVILSVRPDFWPFL
jgi:hemolysin activation/secretion protein